MTVNGHRSTVAFATDPLDLENVVENSEARLGTKLVHNASKRLLGWPGNGDVLDGSARHTHDMVVVACEPLGKFETSDSVGSVMLPEHFGVFEEGKGSIEG